VGRITTRAPAVRISLAGGATRRADTLAVEEPLEIRIGGEPIVVTMRTPGSDVELAAGFLVSEGVLTRADQVVSAIHCGGPGLGGTVAEGNTYNVLDLTLAPGVAGPLTDIARSFYTTSSCGVCGKAAIDAVATVSAFAPAADAATVEAALLARLPDVLRAHQTGFDKTGGLHAAALFGAATGELLVLREDVGRHNAVDKVVGWALQQGRLPLRGTVLMVSGRASFELAQKTAMAGIPILAAVSAPSSLAVELATSAGVTLVGFLRGETMNVYAHAERVLVPGA